MTANYELILVVYIMGAWFYCVGEAFVAPTRTRVRILQDTLTVTSRYTESLYTEYLCVKGYTLYSVRVRVRLGLGLGLRLRLRLRLGLKLGLK